VISPFAQIGDDCVIRQGVTIGQHARDGRAPILGDKVNVGAGAVLIGPIRVGNGAIIGPNVVVTRNVPDGATLFAQPPRVISMPPPREASLESGNSERIEHA
jgi:serine acetyltransferase